MSETNNQDSELHCEHCNKTFVRASTALKHLCERKQRWINRDLVSSRLGYNAWLKFYQQISTNKKKKEFKDFITSNYYTAFVKWGNYCHSIDAVNPSAFLDWLLKNRVPLDQWPKDTNYNKYLIEQLKTENHLDAINRAFDWAQQYGLEAGIQPQHCLIYGNTNRLIAAVTNGRLSPWVLYHSKSGHEFLSGLLPEQSNFLLDYIHPVNWNIIFKRDPAPVSEAQQILAAAGW